MPLTTTNDWWSQYFKQKHVVANPACFYWTFWLGATEWYHNQPILLPIIGIGPKIPDPSIPSGDSWFTHLHGALAQLNHFKQSDGVSAVPVVLSDAVGFASTSGDAHGLIRRRLSRLLVGRLQRENRDAELSKVQQHRYTHTLSHNF